MYFLLILLGDRGKFEQNARYCRFHLLQPDLWIKGNKPRWLLNNKQQTKFDLFHISIMIPTSYKMSFQFEMPMKYTSYLKTMDKIKLFTTPMLLFCLLGCGYREIEYIAYYAMFAYDLSLLLSPEYHVDDIENIENLVVETISICEALFPASEHRMILHQLTELPSKLYDNGPIPGGWGCHSGETTLGKILRSVRKGGTSFDKTLISIIVNKEKALLNKIMCNSKPSPYYNNSEYVINIFGAKLKFELNDFNKNKMLNQLILFIHYVYKDKININHNDKLHNEYNSGLYRLYLGFIYYHNIYPEVDFLSWIKLINSGNINGINRIIDIIDYCNRNYDLNELNENFVEDLNTCD